MVNSREVNDSMGIRGWDMMVMNMVMIKVIHVETAAEGEEEETETGIVVMIEEEEKGHIQEEMMKIILIDNAIDGETMTKEIFYPPIHWSISDLAKLLRIHSDLVLLSYLSGKAG